MTSTPVVGDTFPDFALALPGGKGLTRHDLAGRPAVLFFYPKDDTPGCTTEAKDFTALLPDFAAIGVAVVGISKDPPARHEKFAAKHALGVTLASDAEEGGLSDALGVWAEKQLYGRKFMGMVRSTYLIAADGTIARIWPKVKVRGHAEEVLAAAQAL